MNKLDACKSAQLRANQTGKPYVAIQALNGHWMCEPQANLRLAQQSTQSQYSVHSPREIFVPQSEASRVAKEASIYLDQDPNSAKTKRLEQALSEPQVNGSPMNISEDDADMFQE